jgi:RNA polymerase sigma factor (sigma-70 family)
MVRFPSVAGECILTAKRSGRGAGDGVPGNGGVLEELYGTYGGAVYRRCLRMLGSSDEAESMVQEVFLAMLPRIEKLGEPEKAAHYLFRITTNQCLKRLRRVALRRRTELPELQNREQADDFGGMGRDPSQTVPDVLELRRCIGLVRGRMQRNCFS